MNAVSVNIEVVMSNLVGRKSMSDVLPRRVRVVSTPSGRPGVECIILQDVGSMEMIDTEVLAELSKGIPVLFYVAEENNLSAKEIARVQALAVTLSSPAEPKFVAPDEATVVRIIRAHMAGAEKILIASARIEKDQLWVWSCDRKAYHCKISQLVPLRECSEKQLKKFEISPSGSRLRWPEIDVDLSLEAIRAVADPAVRGAQVRQYRKAAKGYAGAIRALREECGLPQSAIEGLSEREVRRIEQGERIPHQATLEKLAKAHGMGVSEYMSALAAASSGS